MPSGISTFKPRNSIAGNKIQKTNRTQRYLNLAKNIAWQSTYGKIKHGAVLVKGGSVINMCCNKDKFCSFGARFRDSNRGRPTVHAELGCILGLSRNVTVGADIYVCRVNRQGKFRNSKPCAMCHEALKHVGVKRVYYTTNEDVIEMYKL